MTPEEQALLRYRLERAAETLDEAALLYEKGHLHAYVNRLYYACFYAVSALLLTEGKSSGKHSGVRALFNKEWVKQGRVATDYGRLYRRLYDSRQKGDYGDFVQFEDAGVAPWLQEAREFVAAVTAIVERFVERRAKEREGE